MYITMNNPSAHPSYSHYYLLSPSTLFFLFLYLLLSYCFLHIFFAHLIVFCTSYCFLHILLFCTFLFHCTFYSYFSFSYHMYALVLCYLYNLYSYYFALSTERTWFDYISLLIIPCITIMWQIKKPWPWRQRFQSLYQTLMGITAPMTRGTRYAWAFCSFLGLHLVPWRPIFVFDWCLWSTLHSCFSQTTLEYVRKQTCLSQGCLQGTKFQMTVFTLV